MARLAFDLMVMRVLLVEDDTFARELEKTALHQLGVQTLSVANNAEEALDMLNRGLPTDLIIVNWSLPTLDGFDFVEAVHSQWTGLPILMLTSNDGLDQIAQARKAGVDGCLIRPFSLDKLREAIQLALITKLTGGRGGSALQAANGELTEVMSSIQSAIAVVAESGAEGAVGEADGANRFAAKISAQLDSFVARLGAVTKDQKDVVQLHLDCVRAALTGHPKVLHHETQNLIVDGLALAADLVSAERA